MPQNIKDSEDLDAMSSREAEHFSLRDLEAFIEVAELMEAAVKGLISLKELEKRLTTRVEAPGRKSSQAAA